MKKCKVCKRKIKLKAKGQCINCWHKYKRKNNMKFMLGVRYTEIVQRTKNKKYPRYYGMKVCTRKEFMDKFLHDKDMIHIFKQWKRKKYDYKFSPSIDRINSDLGYLIENIQALPHYLNCRKQTTRIKVNVYDRNMTLLSSHDSLNEAVRKYKVQQSNAWKVVSGKRKHTKGFIFKLADNTTRL